MSRTNEVPTHATKKILGLRKGLSQSAECIIVSINDSSHLNYNIVNFMDLICETIVVEHCT